ncbi:hypothetical protein QAD02_005202 [Eretmocerus hayati]|uniref:Uncharacterized protein n=1 Tax=Eretmocerus hayati TaxID=131215 RepID=A0ACC2NRV2_9HYME|nr:hypothetical protein QAD02_005202 [Eretmocerus hayati]
MLSCLLLVLGHWTVLTLQSTILQEDYDTEVQTVEGLDPPSEQAVDYWVSEPSRSLKPPVAEASSVYHEYLRSENSSEDDQYDELPRNHRPESDPHESLHRGAAYVRDHPPAHLLNQIMSESVTQTKRKSKKKSPSESIELLSDDGDRIEFQMRGHEGPKTYIFGFDTGDGKNRQFRLEERSKDGTVKGHYGYYDARGKLRTIKYVARPAEGYEEKHHISHASSDEERDD